MWHLPPTKEEQEAAAKLREEQYARMLEEQRLKREAKEAWLRANTCEHCGRHPPMPPWFTGV